MRGRDSESRSPKTRLGYTLEVNLNSKLYLMSHSFYIKGVGGGISGGQWRSLRLTADKESANVEFQCPPMTRRSQPQVSVTNITQGREVGQCDTGGRPTATVEFYCVRVSLYLQTTLQHKREREIIS